jgi:hypothetical protein
MMIARDGTGVYQVPELGPRGGGREDWALLPAKTLVKRLLISFTEVLL